MAEQEKQELQEYELERVTGGLRLIRQGAVGTGFGSYKVLDVEGLPLIAKQVVITVGGQEYKVQTSQDGVVHLPPLLGTWQVEFQKARVRLPDEACRG